MIDENGNRVDGRKAGDIRPIEIELGVVPVADGSASMRWGTNYVIASVYGPMEAHPRKMLQAEAHMRKVDLLQAYPREA
ncbi:MAG TPA: hypothetical protein EYQ78_00050 [Candidatus Poseidoniales archaeon]|nr:hypothetical protein [Candidatus Poseidoniales archaeon]